MVQSLEWWGRLWPMLEFLVQLEAMNKTKASTLEVIDVAGGGLVMPGLTEGEACIDNDGLLW
jgi:hypothetical protein